MGGRALSLCCMFLALAILTAAGPGCKKEGDVLLLVGNQAPEIADVADQSATEGSPFVLDFSSYVTDDKDDVADLSFLVVSGGGSFTDTTYLNTFFTPGTAIVRFMVMDTEGLGAVSSFNVIVNPMANNPPVVGAMGPYAATLGYAFVLDVAGSVTDDNDDPENLTYEVTSGEGLFIGHLYTATYDSTGLHTIGFTVTDSGSQSATGTFGVDVSEPVPINEPPVIQNIPTRDSTMLEMFSYDLSPYVSDARTPTTGLTFGVTSGEGSFSGTTYSNTFDSTGLRTVTFIVMDDEGMSSAGSFDVNINDYANTPPDVSASIPDQTASLNVTFVFDLEPYVSDAQDGIDSLTFSTTSGGSFAGPVYVNTFTTDATHIIDFNVVDSRGGSSTGTFNVIVYSPPGAEFSCSPTEGLAPLSVSFFDKSVGDVTSWEWDIDNDGTADYTTQIAAHVYTNPGTYTVTLTVHGLGGTDIEKKLDCITVIDPAPVGDFEADTTYGVAPLTVNFADTSTGYITKWEWDFDNDGSYDLVYGTHMPEAQWIYSTPGVYSVALRVTGPSTSDVMTKTDYITVVWAPLSTVYVGTTGNDVNGTGAPDDPYLTIQRAIDLVSNSCTVVVHDGVHSGVGNRDIDFKGKAIMVTSSGGFASCTIDCLSAGRGFHFHNAEDSSSVLQGFTITNGDAATGGGIYCESASPVITDCFIVGCSATTDGGAVCCDNSSAHITACLIDSCDTTNNGGGICCKNNSDVVIDNSTVVNDCVASGDGGAIACDSSALDVQDCEITQNAAFNNGGGIYLNNSTAVVFNCLLDNDSASGNGGGLYCRDSGSNVTLDTLTITNCSAGDDGGGVMCYDGVDFGMMLCDLAFCFAGRNGGGIGCFSSAPTIISSFVDYCTSLGSEADRGGGGIYCVWANASIVDVTVSNCRSESLGGGIYCDLSIPLIEACDILDNDSISHGGGIAITGSGSNADISTCLIADNTSAADGGGAYCQDCAPQFGGCDIAGNWADDQGGGVYCSNAPAEFIMCDIRDNGAPIEGAGVKLDASNAQVIWCTIRGNGDPSYGPFAGGGLRCIASVPLIAYCTVSDNWALLGGGMSIQYTTGGTPPIIELVNSLICNNTGDIEGGGIHLLDQSYVQLLNCTIANNLANGGGGGGLVVSAYPVEAYNTIMWGNLSTAGIGHQAFIVSLILAFNCNVPSIAEPDFTPALFIPASLVVFDPPPFAFPGSPGVAGGGDYHLIAPTGPTGAVDTGDVTFLDAPYTPWFLTEDLDHMPRVVGPSVDMGCYEMQP